MKIGIYGGSFNPVHYGHTGLAIWIAGHTDIDEVWLMVTPNNPLKRNDDLSSENERYNNAKIAVSSAVRDWEKHTGRKLKPVRVCDFEFGLPRPNYTANTLKELKKAYPQHDFCLIIGEDNWQLFTHWREWEEIGKNHLIYVYPRRAAGTSDDVNKIDLNSFKGVYFLKDAPLYNISSTELRQAKKVQHTYTPLSNENSRSANSPL